MAERAGLGAQTFLLPQPVAQRPEAQAQPFNDGIQALEGLQYVKGQTADYYKKAADLKSFMQSVQQNLGIDVRVPDLSRPESIKLNQIYRDAIADIQAHGNELKQGAAINNMLISRGDIQTGTYGNQSAARAEYGKDFFNRNLEPSIMELNNKLQMPSYTREEYEQKEAARKAAVNFWTEQAKDPSKKEYAEYQLRGISPTTQGQWRPQADTSYDKKQASADNAMEVAFRKAVNFAQGVSPQWKASTKPVEGKPGRFYMQNNEYAGFKYGDYPAPIKTAYIDQSSDGTGYFVLQDGTKVDFDKNDPVPLLQGLADTNPRFGFTGAQMYDYAQRNGIYTGTGAVDVSKYIDVPENRKKEQERMKQEETEIAKIQTVVANKIKQQGAGKKWWLLKGNDRVQLPIKLGGANEIKLEATGNGTFNVENFDEVFKPLYTKDNKVDTVTKNELKTYFNSEQPLDVIIQKLLPMINKSQYGSVLKALGITEEDLKNVQIPDGGATTSFDASGTNSAPTKVTPANTGGAY